MKERDCRECGRTFPLLSVADNNRQLCSRACAKKRNDKKIKQFHVDNPGKWPIYNGNRTRKDPTVWVKKSRQERAEVLSLLGNRCVVCGVNNPLWLHVDYIPTNKASPYRHPRNLGFVRRNLNLFRILCANHHYELTLSGRIEGTNIEQ